MLLPIREEHLSLEVIPILVFSNVPLVFTLEEDAPRPPSGPLLHVLLNRTIPPELIQELHQLGWLHLVLAHEPSSDSRLKSLKAIDDW